MNALEKLVEQGRKEGRKEGLKEGHKEGREEGREEGRREMLLQLLTAKFGPVPAAAAARIQEAALAELEAWTPRVLTAASVAEVFAEPRARPRAKR
jgi:flagellar biosynthesis/type III secretory pathway protein FliH